MATRKVAEYRVLERVADAHGERAHLARLDTSRSLCGQVTFDGSPFDPWQAMGEEVSPEDAEMADRCASCWAAWETEKRADRERRGLWNPPERTHVRAKRRRVAPQIASQRIADRAAAKRQPAPDVFRMLKPELIALGTPKALAELDRRQAKRAAKRERRAA